MKSTSPFAVAVIVAFVIGNRFAVSDDQPTPSAPDPVQRILKLVQPGEVHADMAFLCGEWDVTVKMVIPGQGEMPPQTGTSTFEWLIDGRWMGERLSGLEFMGEPYEGFGIHGYDNHKKNFVTCWVSSMDTQMIALNGPSVEPKNLVIAQYGRMNEWMDDTFDKAIKSVTRRIDDNTFTVEIWDLQIGADGAVVIEYTYRRKTLSTDR